MTRQGNLTAVIAGTVRCACRLPPSEVLSVTAIKSNKILHKYSRYLRRHRLFTYLIASTFKHINKPRIFFRLLESRHNNKTFAAAFAEYSNNSCLESKSFYCFTIAPNEKKVSSFIIPQFYDMTKMKAGKLSKR